MSDVNKWTNWFEWLEECKRRGLTDGPHSLWGRPHGSWQFVDGNGTAAIWNGEHNLGSIFRAAKTQEAGQK